MDDDISVRQAVLVRRHLLVTILLLSDTILLLLRFLSATVLLFQLLHQQGIATLTQEALAGFCRATVSVEQQIALEGLEEERACVRQAIVRTMGSASSRQHATNGRREHAGFWDAHRNGVMLSAWMANASASRVLAQLMVSACKLARRTLVVPATFSVARGTGMPYARTGIACAERMSVITEMECAKKEARLA
jgi:hypothetical protein